MIYEYILYFQERFYNMINDETIINFYYHRICGLLNFIFCGL